MFIRMEDFVFIIGYGCIGGYKNYDLWCCRLIVYVISIIFVSVYFVGILRGFCCRFVEGGGVLIIDVSNDWKVMYVFYRDKLLYFMSGWLDFRGCCFEFNVCFNWNVVFYIIMLRWGNVYSVRRVGIGKCFVFFL